MSDEMRRCKRCRKEKPAREFPDPVRGKLRPFCVSCTNYIHWVTA